MTHECIIIGAGLSGLYTAYRLEQAGIDYRVLEARNRIGGRIDCVTRTLPDGQASRFDLGPAWVWPQLQPLIAELTDALGVSLFPQRVHGAGLYEDMSTGGPVRLDTPSPHGDSFRIADGGLSLVEALAERLAPDRLVLDARVTRLVETVDVVHVETGDGRSLAASRVVSAMPLRIFAERLECVPALPRELSDHLNATPTWMAGHAKFLAFYEEPFWERQGLSGEVFSRIGPLTEIYDASPVGAGPRALFGFFGLAAEVRRRLGRDALVEHSLAQLERLFGAQAQDALDVCIKDWSQDPLTATAADAQAPRGHPAYGMPPEMRAIWDGRLIFCGSESAAESGGYLEGALEAGRDAAAGILRRPEGAKEGDP